MFRKRHPEVGACPGTLVLNPNAEPVQLRVHRVTRETVWAYNCHSTAQLPAPNGDDGLLWIDVHGVGDGTVLQELAHRFRISPLAMEDLINTPKRPKSEMYEHQQLVIAHCLVVTDYDRATVGQIGIVFGTNYVLTFHQGCDHALEPIRRRLNNPNARMRHSGPDYLVYAILDSCVDGCYPFLEGLGDMIEGLEQATLNQPRPEILAQIQTAKNVLARLRRSIWPQKEVALALQSGESPYVADETRQYFRDTAEHCSQLGDVVEMYRESTSGLVNMYMSSVAHRSNEIMKVLTLLSSVFVPPTFLAGVYGMNFSRMPELDFPWAYPLALGAMLTMIFGTVLFFYRRGWLHGVILAAKSSTAADLAKSNASAEQHDAMQVAQNIVLKGDFEAVRERAA